MMKNETMTIYKNKYIFLKMAFLFWGLLSFYESSACRYTVREIGYTDLGETDYHLYMIVDDLVEEATIKDFKQIGYAVLMDSNVKVSVVNIDNDKRHLALDYLDIDNRAKGLVEFLLVSPEGKAKLITTNGILQKEMLWDVMETLVNSEIRDRMVKEFYRSYGALLLVEGKNPIENLRVRKVAEKAIEEIQAITGAMAKPIDVPVRLYVLPYAKRKSEEILLWSMGVSLEDKDPYLVTLFGRGRMMGAPLKGWEITSKETFKLLSIIGADCECGLERKWLLGSAVPFRWGMEQSSLLAAELGFDVENPMVKSEMSQILSIDISVIDKISTDTYVNSLERIESKEEESGFSKQVVVYTLLIMFFFVCFLGVFYYLKLRRR